MYTQHENVIFVKYVLHLLGSSLDCSNTGVVDENFVGNDIIIKMGHPINAPQTCDISIMS